MIHTVSTSTLDLWGELTVKVLTLCDLGDLKPNFFLPDIPAVISTHDVSIPVDGLCVYLLSHAVYIESRA